MIVILNCSKFFFFQIVTILFDFLRLSIFLNDFFGFGVFQIDEFKTLRTSNPPFYKV